MGEIGVPELLVILGVALLIFGPKKIGELGKGLGVGIRNFKNSMKDSSEPAQPAATTSQPVIEAPAAPAEQQVVQK